MNTVDRLLRLNIEPLTVEGETGRIVVSYARCELKDGIMLRSVCGIGKDFNEACERFIEEISGKTLVFNASCENRREVIVL